MGHALTRSKDCLIAGLIALGVVASLPLLGVLALALRPVLVVAALAALAGGCVLCGCCPSFREWLDAQTEPEIEYRGLRMAPDIAFHPSHSWARINGEVTVGADDLVQAALGPIDEVELPPPGQHVRRGDRLFRLRHADRSIDVRAPVSGTVVSSNPALRGRPGLVNEKPFGAGWAVRLHGDELDEERRSLLRGRRAREWFRHEVDRLIGTAPPPDTAGRRGLDDDAWRRLASGTSDAPDAAEER